ncbi:MAG: glycosyltransferase family 4 protein [Rhodospirillaceae bacterium]
MKPPDSAVPSGDREMARNLMRALALAGHDVALASRFVSRDGRGDAARQTRLADLGSRLADRLIRRWQDRTDAGRESRPDAWFTYHLYHKAPDRLGPRVAAALGIPYLVAEASHAPKQAGGPWDSGYRAAESALRSAHAVIGLSSADAACVRPLLRDTGRYRTLPPFTDTGRFAAAADRRGVHRAALCARGGWPASSTLLLAVGMMRPGDKLASYRALAAALQRTGGAGDWRLAIAGDGPARADVAAAFSHLPAGRIAQLGAISPDDLPALYAGADILAWPAINEAYGMALLEAQAAGLPAVAGRAGGVADIVRDGTTGLLTPEGDVKAFAAALSRLIAAPGEAAAMRDAARRLIPETHGLAGAATALDLCLAAARHAAAGDRRAA